MLLPVNRRAMKEGIGAVLRVGRHAIRAEECARGVLEVCNTSAPQHGEQSDHQQHRDAESPAIARHAQGHDDGSGQQRPGDNRGPDAGAGPLHRDERQHGHNRRFQPPSPLASNGRGARPEGEQQDAARECERVLQDALEQHRRDECVEDTAERAADREAEIEVGEMYGLTDGPPPACRGTTWPARRTRQGAWRPSARAAAGLHS